MPPSTSSRPATAAAITRFIATAIATATLLAALTACSGGDGGSSPAADRMSSASLPAVSSDSGCTILADPVQGRTGSYSVYECLPPDYDPRGGVRLHFVLDSAGHRSTADYTLEASTYSAVLRRPVPRLWEGYIITLDLPVERGGRLLIANHTEAGFVLSAYDYNTTDEGSLELNWNRGTFVTSTQVDGQVNLVPATYDGARVGEFEPEWLGCSEEDPEATYHALRMPVDASGRILAISYLSATPTLEGAPLLCSMDFNRLDGESEWTDDGFGGVTVTVRGSARPGQQPDQVVVTRAGSSYAVELFVMPDVYCGQSARLASEIQFTRGSRDCGEILMAVANAVPPRTTGTLVD